MKELEVGWADPNWNQKIICSPCGKTLLVEHSDLRITTEGGGMSSVVYHLVIRCYCQKLQIIQRGISPEMSQTFERTENDGNTIRSSIFNRL